ncbi:hypothetical protein AMAG_18738 [Allomyces macrogynus ATCC 38327]|uniref:Uncharacterized protein n=1 Tax=Allomyces macrogynus (strain ATCC 38327) TaxID=578462 RepID=A0A0L0SFD0_ALLM3|nr:hypothetical protein AMAG_18738 [Allomyces macrogynus ATCC 38327]|eukprot:KNE61075.1 hypothetical protein AMAG_18738 [Allomyces macrogynus ATCC 38327]
MFVINTKCIDLLMSSQLIIQVLQVSNYLTESATKDHHLGIVVKCPIINKAYIFKAIINALCLECTVHCINLSLLE